MTVFLLGLVLGGIVGVICDRIWSRVERTPRLEFTFANGVGDRNRRFFMYRVTNVGMKELVDYEIMLNHPGRYGLFVFPSDKSGPLQPGQTREHTCFITQADGSRPRFLEMYFHTLNRMDVETVVCDLFDFQIIMKESEVVLFESRVMGNALADQFARLIEPERPEGSAWENHLKLSTPPPTKRKRRLRWAMELAGLRYPIPRSEYDKTLEEQGE